MPRSGNTIRNHSLLTAALEGLELQKQRIDEQIQEVRLLLGKSPARRGRPPGVSVKRAPGRLSPAARKRIAAAQKRRWAEYRKSNNAKTE
ncbi:MAG TPA: hypothetical protein VME17_05395 [Bryobacteraceae bacterium]|nr:hypothetical protein [Bryobacteraceae bacterium]